MDDRKISNIFTTNTVTTTYKDNRRRPSVTQAQTRVRNNRQNRPTVQRTSTTVMPAQQQQRVLALSSSMVVPSTVDLQIQVDSSDSTPLSTSCRYHISGTHHLASHADVLRGSSSVPKERLRGRQRSEFLPKNRKISNNIPSKWTRASSLIRCMPKLSHNYAPMFRNYPWMKWTCFWSNNKLQKT